MSKAGSSSGRSTINGSGPAGGGRWRLPVALRLLLFGLTLVVMPAVDAQQGPGPDLDAAQALLAEGQAAAVYDLLSPFEARFAGDLRFDYLLARSALDSGKPSVASFIYERILAVEPNYAGVRLENGRAYLELQDYARAKQEFETVLRFEELPPDLKGAAEQYLSVTEERLSPKTTFLNASAQYGFGYDSNVNSGIAEAAVGLPGGLLLVLDPLSRERGDFYHALNAGGEVLHRLDENWQVFAGVDYSGRLHLSETLFDSHDLNGRAGVGYSTGRHNIRLSGKLGRFFIDDSRLRDLSGASLDWLHAVDERNQVTASTSYLRYRFPSGALESLEFDSYGASVGWNHAFAEGRALVGLSANAGFEDALGGRLDGDQVNGGLGVSLQGVITDTVGGFGFAGVQRGNYRDRNTLFGLTRHDTLYSAGAGISWSFAKGWSLQPRVSWSRNLSNVPLNDYDRTDISLSLRGNL